MIGIRRPRVRQLTALVESEIVILLGPVNMPALAQGAPPSQAAAAVK